MMKRAGAPRAAALLGAVALGALLLGCQTAPPATEATPDTAPADTAPPASTATPIPPTDTPEPPPSQTAEPPTPTDAPRVIEQRTGEAVEAWAKEPPGEGSLSGDGQRVLLALDEGLTVIDRASGDAQVVDAALEQAGPWPTALGAKLSADGSTVAFWSTGVWTAPDGTAYGCAKEPEPGEGCMDLLIYDTGAGEIVEAIPVGNAYGLGMIADLALSADGQVIAFAAIEIAGRPGVWVVERASGAFTQAAERGVAVDVSADGSVVAFATSEALTEDDANEATDVYVLDRATGSVERISQSAEAESQPSGVDPFHEGISPGLALSADGRWVAFVSRAALTGDDFTACELYTGEALPACQQIYLHDRETGETGLISAANDGTPGDDVSQTPRVSADGQIVVFSSNAGNLIDGGPLTCAMFGDGNCRQVFVRDRAASETALLSAGADGAVPDSFSNLLGLTPDGAYALLYSDARNLLAAGEGGPGYVLWQVREP